MRGVDRDVSNGYFSSPNSSNKNGLYLIESLAKWFPWKPQTTQAIDKAIFHITQTYDPITEGNSFTTH